MIPIPDLRPTVIDRSSDNFFWAVYPSGPNVRDWEGAGKDVVALEVDGAAAKRNELKHCSLRHQGTDLRGGDLGLRSEGRAAHVGE